jgi:BirA family transcriptional regulator, biotin operon repressor / biotin---[acetyl-CoA-carboxylase] ligase
VDAPALREAVRAAGIHAEPVLLYAVDSTNTALLRMAGDGAPAWSVLAAREQTGGRGRLGRTWYSPRDASLALSVLLRPALDTTRLPLVALAAGVAMSEACSSAGGVDVRCKWPNDLVVADRKAGGILSEAVVRPQPPATVVVGTGVNLMQTRADFPEALRDVATSLAVEGGRTDESPIVTSYLRVLRELVERTDPAPAIVDRYRQRCSTIGRRVAASMANGARIEGDAIDVDDSGALLVRTGTGVERVGFGEVEHLRARD